MKLKCVKLANSVKCGTKEETFFLASQFEIDLEGQIITLKHLGLGDETKTSIMNAVYWKEMPESVKVSHAVRKREVNI